MTTPHETPHLMTINELSTLLGVAVKTLRNWRCLGQGPRAVIIGGRVRYRPQEVDEWIAQQVESHVHA